MHFLVPSVLALMAGIAHCSPGKRGALPIVDLGYVKQQASTYNATGRYYNFTNIAFAEPPLGDLRFAAPHPPKKIEGIQSGGNYNFQCPQGGPLWLGGSLEKQPGETEDCLYLDVLVPEKIFEQGESAKAPVFVYIYGGGFELGSKTGNGNADGLVARGMQDADSDGMIVVVPNYRVGAFGFLGGHDLQTAGGSSNAGLLDQRMALDWIQENICKFGGSPNRVTLIGESGGASSIGHHLTTPSSRDRSPFEQAIYQSPAEVPYLNDTMLNENFASFLEALIVNSLEQARNLSTDALQDANRNIGYHSPEGHFAFGLSVDGSYVLGTVNEELEKGQFSKSVKIVTAYNSDEGDLFLTSNTTLYSDFPAYVANIIPTASQASINHIANTIYPTSSFPEPYDRARLFIGELFVYCNAYALQKAYNGTGYPYEFSLPPGYHTQDIYYTLYNGVDSPNNQFGPVNDTVAMDMQTYFAKFATYGSPNAAKGTTPRQMPLYGEHGQMLDLTNSEYQVVDDAHKNVRCEFWAKYNYD